MYINTHTCSYVHYLWYKLVIKTKDFDLFSTSDDIWVTGEMEKITKIQQLDIGHIRDDFLQQIQIECVSGLDITLCECKGVCVWKCMCMCICSFVF